MPKVKRIIAAIKAWSFSRFKDHRECPAKLKYKHIDKVPEGPKGPALIRGEAIHKEGEDFLKGKKKQVPTSFKLFHKEMLELRKHKAVSEGKWAMDIKWAVADFFDWVRAWCRVVLDAHYLAGRRARVIDFKTGRIYDDNSEQMELYAIAGFAHYTQAEEVSTELWYLDQPRDKDNPRIKVFHRKQLPALQKKWKEKVIPLLTEQRFAPRPGDYCNRCSYSKRRGGPCKF